MTHSDYAARHQFQGQYLPVSKIMEITGLADATIRERILKKIPLEAPFQGPMVEYEIDGLRLTIPGWAKHWGISKRNAQNRLAYYRKLGRAIHYSNGSNRSRL